MNNIRDFLSGHKVLEEVNSPINGKLTVVKDIVWGTYIKTGNLAQSGGVVDKVWNTTLKKLAKKKKDVDTCLILGLGGGGMVKVVEKYWPEAKIVGVDIDPVFVNLGRKYMDLDDREVDIVIEDAYKYVTRNNKKANKYDLVCVDVYVGDRVPEKFKSKEFVEMVKALLSKDGYAVFNRLYSGDERVEAMKFLDSLKEVFDKVETVHPEANIMFICNN